MAKAGRKPAGLTLDDLEAPIRADILNAVDSAKEESAKSIYDRFALHHRDVSWHWFRRFVSDRRNADDFEPQMSDEPPTWDELDSLMRATIADKVRAGDVKVYECGTVLRRCFEERVVRIKEEEERRAAEKFDEWKRKRDAELADQHRKAERSMREDGLSDEAISRIHAIYGIGAARDDG